MGPPEYEGQPEPHELPPSALPRSASCGGFRTDWDAQAVMTPSGQWIALSRRPYDPLTVLLFYSPHVVPHAVLVACVWGEHTDPAERSQMNDLYQVVHSLRARLGDDSHSIVSLRGLGYRFAGRRQPRA
jgi:DNA-binding response OmpR family regulator